MKILIWNSFYLSVGGSQKLSHFLAKDLNDQGINECLATSKEDSMLHNPVFGELPNEILIYRDSFINPWNSSKNLRNFF